jgi:hypothetical protein
MKPPIDVFSLVERLSAGRPLRREAVEHALGAPLRADEAQNNVVVTVYRGGPFGEWLRSAELRAPTDADLNDTSLLIVDLADADWPSQRAVTERLGADYRLEVPTPRQPANEPVNLVYRKPWGSISFGYSRQTPERLTRIVVATNNTRG